MKKPFSLRAFVLLVGTAGLLTAFQNCAKAPAGQSASSSANASNGSGGANQAASSPTEIMGCSSQDQMYFVKFSADQMKVSVYKNVSNAYAMITTLDCQEANQGMGDFKLIKVCSDPKADGGYVLKVLVPVASTVGQAATGSPFAVLSVGRNGDTAAEMSCYYNMTAGTQAF